MRKPKKKIAVKDMKWTSTKFENVQERSDKRAYRIRLTKIKTGSDGKPVMITNEETGKVRYAREEYLRFFKTKQPAIDAVPAAKVEFLSKQPIIDVTTFAELVKEFSTTLTPAVYDDDPKKAKHEKLSGLAGWQDGLRVMKMFGEVFGDRPIRSINADEIIAWKAKRYATRRGKNKDLKRTLAGVNGELRFLSKAFGFAIQKRWLDRNPFQGAKIINSKFETRREIALTRAEEKKLLDACDHPFLKMLLIFLFDTGMRLGEARGLTRGMIKLDQGLYGHLYLQAQITKGKERRNLPVLTPRLREVIKQRLAMIPDDPKALLFGKKDSIRFAWDVTRERAKLERNQETLEVDLRDTRHTWISRAVPSGIPLPEAMLYSGHKVVDTFLRYLQPDQKEHNANALRYEAFMAANEVQETITSDQVN